MLTISMQLSLCLYNAHLVNAIGFMSQTMFSIWKLYIDNFPFMKIVYFIYLQTCEQCLLNESHVFMCADMLSNFGPMYSMLNNPSQWSEPWPSESSNYSSDNWNLSQYKLFLRQWNLFQKSYWLFTDN